MKYFYKRFELEIPENVYPPKEDSELLAENIHAQKDSFVLDKKMLTKLYDAYGTYVSPEFQEQMKAIRKQLGQL